MGIRTCCVRRPYNNDYANGHPDNNNVLNYCPLNINRAAVIYIMIIYVYIIICAYMLNIPATTDVVYLTAKTRSFSYRTIKINIIFTIDCNAAFSEGKYRK